MATTKAKTAGPLGDLLRFIRGGGDSVPSVAEAVRAVDLVDTELLRAEGTLKAAQDRHAEAAMNAVLGDDAGLPAAERDLAAARVRHDGLSAALAKAQERLVEAETAARDRSDAAILAQRGAAWGRVQRHLAAIDDLVGELEHEAKAALAEAESLPGRGAADHRAMIDAVGQLAERLPRRLLSVPIIGRVLEPHVSGMGETTYSVRQRDGDLAGWARAMRGKIAGDER